MSEISKLSAALWYAKSGISVFPLHHPTESFACSCGKQDCDSPGKHPRTRNGFKDATIDPARITAWWHQWPDANIGIPTGADNHLLVVDCDPRNGGPTTRTELSQRVGPIPETTGVNTGGGGLHLYLYYAGGPVPKTLVEGIDLKGDGGYVVAPPSLHISGQRYAWDGVSDWPDSIYAANAPEWLVERIAKPQALTRKKAKPPTAALAEILVDGQKWGKGERNNNLTSLAGTMRRRGFSREAIEKALLEENQQRCDPPLAEAEVLRITESVASYEPEGDNSSQRVAEIALVTDLAQRAVDGKDPTNCYAEDLIHAVAVTPAKQARDLAAKFKSTFGEDFNITRFKADVRDARAALSYARIQAQNDGGTNSESQFRLTNEAVVYIDPSPDKQPIRICGWLEVAALIRHAGGDGWGRVLKWKDPEGRAHQWAMPVSLLAGDASECRARLLDGGLFISPSRRAHELLTTYLQTIPERLALCVSRVGWRGNVFVLPDATIGPDGAETVLFQTPHESEHLLNVSGTAEDWRDNVGRFCSGNSRLVLSASCGFAGPVLSLVDEESGGVHYHGASSKGKTTVLLVGASVLGGGGRNGFVQSWRATANGLEAIAELHNNLTLFLDEIAQMDPREAAEIAYLLANGSGKGRMSRNIGARKKLVWSLLFVSAGEVTLADHALTVGKRTKGGAEVRLLNIDADAGANQGLFENIHGAKSPDAFARQLQDAARRFYGAPLRAYLPCLVHSLDEATKTVRHARETFLQRFVPSGATGEVQRAAGRFAVIGAAGELATEYGLTGWEAGEAMSAAERCFKAWLSGRGTPGSLDAENGLRQTRAFIGAHGASRFQPTRRAPSAGDGGLGEQPRVINRAGFLRQDSEGETEYLILQDVFRNEVCAGFDYRTVLKTLDERGFLAREHPAMTITARLPELGKTRVYCVRAALLEGE